MSLPALTNGTIRMPVYQGDAETGMHHLVLSWSFAGTLPDGRTFRITIARGFTFDGCSIPRFLWRLCGHPMEVPRIAAAIAHDWLYAAHLTSRKLADQIYGAICLAVNMSRVRTEIEYDTLRLFGGAAWKSHGAADEAAARSHGHLVINGQVVNANPDKAKE